MLGNLHIPSAHPSPFTILKWSVYVAVPAFLWAGVNFQTLRHYFNASATLDQNRVEVSKLEKELAELQSERKMLDLGGFPAEKAIRERFKMVLPGENVIFIQDDAENDAPSPGSDERATTRTASLRPLVPGSMELPR